MSEKEIELFFSILSSALFETPISSDSVDNEQTVSTMLERAKKHDIAHLLAFGLKENGIKTELDETLEKYIYNAVYRHKHLTFEIDRLTKILENAKIPFMPLKGSVMRGYYPKGWMRTSCDLDILVRNEDVERASKLLSESGYLHLHNGSHDIAFSAPSRVHVELHFNLIEDGKIADNLSSVLSRVWDMAVIKPGFEFWYEMPDELFYFYHLAHTAKHFLNGGCGIRPFIDLWILDNIESVDREKRAALIQEGGISKFEETAVHLSRVWFGNEEHDSLTQGMQNFILYGGVYGTSKNRIWIQQQKMGGRLQYAFSRIWIPYDTIKHHYPVLQKHRWLMPLMQVRRWCKLVFCGGAKRSIKELSFGQSISQDNAMRMKNFLEKIGL